MQYQTIKFNVSASIGTIQLYRPDADNAINEMLVEDCIAVIQSHPAVCVWVLEGLNHVFCSGADFGSASSQLDSYGEVDSISQRLYTLWTLLAQGDFISVAVVRGKVIAGGVGFVAACDIVLSEPTVTFAFTEMLFGLFPACVMPFLIRRTGYQKANYMTLSLQTVDAETALRWGIVDAVDADIKNQLRLHMLRLKKISKQAIGRYKRYSRSLWNQIEDSRDVAIHCHDDMFSAPDVRDSILRFSDLTRH